MPKYVISSLALAAALLVASGAAATTYVPMTDGALADRAALVVRARVVAAEPGPLGEAPSTDYTVEVEHVVSGFAPGTTLIVRVPGGPDGSGRRLKVWGAPAFAVGERALLFLAPRADGAFGILHLMLGAFHERRENGRELWVRDLSEAHNLSAASSLDETAPEPVRHAARFERWLEDRAVGVHRPADYAVASATRAVAEFTYISDLKMRWPDFEQGGAVQWKAHQGGQPRLDGGGFAEFQQALQSWNADAATNIQYVYAGTTAATTGLEHFDGVNAILFDDPNSEAEGTFDCGAGGVLAIGGPWYDDESGPPFRIGGADVVVNDGAGCWFAEGAQGRLRAAEVYAHELGHTLGLGHSCGDDSSGDCDTAAKSSALMRAQAKRVSLGAVLGADDRAAILTLYAGAGGGGGGGGVTPLAAPSGLAAVAARTSVVLTWLDNSGGEKRFLIDLRKPSQPFAQVAVAPKNATSKTLTGLKPNTAYEVRVRAKGGRGKVSEFSAVLSFKTQP